MMWRGFRSKFLSIFLILTLLIGMGGVNSFAMEGDEIPPATEDEIILEEDIIPEEIENDNLEKENEEEIEDLLAPQSNEVLLESSTIDVATAEELEDALDTIRDGGTIKLLNSIDYNKGIVIDGKTVTFDVDSFTLNVTNTLTGSTHGVGLEVENRGHVNLVGTGEFNVTTINGAASSDGVVVRENSSAMVTNVETISGSGNGVYADGDGAVIHVLGNIEAKGSNSCGARTWMDGSITIDGTVAKGRYYVYIHEDPLFENEGVTDSEKPGYLKYSIEKSPGIVWIKNALPLGDNVCAIGDKEYETLDKSLEEVKTGETIQLLKSIDYDKGIIIEGKEVTFDVGSYTLNVVNSSGTGLEVIKGGEVLIEGEGQFNVTGAGYGVYVDSESNKESSAMVTNTTATPDGDICYGAYAYKYGSEIIVLGNAKASGVNSVGVRANENATITVKGNAEGDKNGVVAEFHGKVTVEGDVKSTGKESIALLAQIHGKVFVKGDVLASGEGSYGARVLSGATVEVEGNVEGVKYGVDIGDSTSTMTVGNDVIATGESSTGILAIDNSTVIINGNVKAINGVGVYSQANVTIDGTITAHTYIRFHNGDKAIGEYEENTTKAGYHTYKGELESFVWVKVPEDEPIEPIAKIGTKEYTTLDEALLEVKTGETIQLLKNINYDKGIKIQGKKITFDVGSYTLNVINPSGTGLEVLHGGEVALVGTGQFNVTGAGYGVYVSNTLNKPTKATVTNAVATTAKEVYYCYGVYSDNKGSEVIVLGNAIGTSVNSVGARANSGGTITVYGDVEGGKNGAVAEESSSTINVKGDVKSTSDQSVDYGTPIAVYVQYNGKVTVGGNVLASGNNSIGAQIISLGEIKVTGNVQGKLYGAFAIGDSIEVDGNAIGGERGAYAYQKGHITIGKDSTGTDYGIFADYDSMITVNGNAIATENGSGAYASHSAQIFIKGDAISKSSGSSTSGYGASAYYGGEIVIEGNVQGSQGAYSYYGSKITIEGNAIGEGWSNNSASVVAESENSSVILEGNTSGNSFGAISLNGGNIIIDGRINQKSYIKLDNTIKGRDEMDKDSTKVGYHTYSDDNNIVWVKIAEEDTDAPTWPNDSTITAVDTSSTTLNLIWPKAEDNVGVDKYLIYTVTVTGDTEEETLIGEVSSDNEREFEVKDLVPESEYTIRIKAEDSAGNISEGSLQKTFKTKKAFTVTFDSQGGTLVNNQIIREGETVINPITTRVGFSFGGWFKDSECSSPWDFNIDIITGDITLYANWIEGEIEPPTTPVITTNLPTTKSVTKGETVTLTVNANVSDGGTLSYQWYKDGITIVGANANSLTIINASSSDSGSYKVRITNTKDGISSLVESTLCVLKVNSTSGGGGNSGHTPVDKDKKKDKDIKKPEEIINVIIILDIDQDILDENTLVPYYINNRDDIIVKLSAIFDGKMHLIGNSNIDYLLKDNMKYFTDISNHWAKNDINFVTAREFFRGTGTDEFGPDIPISRAMFATTLGKLWGVDISLYKTSRFNDVKIDKSYAPYVEWAAENGIVNGIGNNCFGPEKLITREEIAVMITSFINYTNLTLKEDDVIIPVFTDYNTISEWAKESVRTIQNSGIICGKPGNIFDPQGMTTRAEAAVMLKRLIIDVVK